MNVQASPVSDKGEGRLSREEWLEAVLHSGEVTRVSQHLALVIFHLTKGDTIAKFSGRDLERITGWSKSTIIDHLSELEMFMRIKWGKGRGKSEFELLGVVESAIHREITVRLPDSKHRSCGQEADTKSFVRDTDTTADATLDTIFYGRLPDTRTMFTQADEFAKKEKNPQTPKKEKPLQESLTQNQWIGLSPLPPENEKRIEWQNGRLVLFNGCRQFWLERFDGDARRLDLALAQAAGYIQPNDRLRPLEAQVGAQLARIAGDRHDKDRRYASAVQASKKAEGRPPVKPRRF